MSVTTEWNDFDFPEKIIGKRKSFDIEFDEKERKNYLILSVAEVGYQERFEISDDVDLNTIVVRLYKKRMIFYGDKDYRSFYINVLEEEE